MRIALRVRQIAASALLAGFSGHSVYRALTATWTMRMTEAIASAVVLGVGAIAFSRRSLFAQIVGRGAAWMWLANIAAAYVSADTMAWWAPYGMAACAAALGLSHPLLHTPEAQASFAPARFRRLFLIGATATSGVAATALYYAAFGVYAQVPAMIAFNVALAATLLLAVRGLLGMRTWGALLGGLASVVCLASIPFWYISSMSLGALTLAAAPALLFWILPIAIAMAGPRRVRVAGEAPQLRIAELAEETEEAVDEELVDAREVRRHAVVRDV